MLLKHKLGEKDSLSRIPAKNEESFIKYLERENTALPSTGTGIPCICKGLSYHGLIHFPVNSATTICCGCFLGLYQTIWWFYQLLHVVFLAIYSEKKPRISKVYRILHTYCLFSLRWEVCLPFPINQNHSNREVIIFFVSLLMKQNSPFAIQSCIFRNCFFVLTMHPWPLLVQPSQLWQLLFKSLHSKKLFSNFSVLPETALNRHKGAEKMKLPSTGFFYWVNSAVIDFTDLFKNLINFTSPS